MIGGGFMDNFTRGSGPERACEGQGSSGIAIQTRLADFMHDNDRHDISNRLSDVNNIRSSLNTEYFST